MSFIFFSPLIRTGRRGVTLVEMLVVVAVVGTSLALGMPLFRSVSVNGQSPQMQDACDAQMQALAQAQEEYRVRNRVYGTTISEIGCVGLRCPCATTTTSASDYVINTYTDSSSNPAFRITCPIASAHQTGKKRQLTDDSTGINLAYINN